MSNRVRDHDGAAVCRKEQYTIAQGVEHLIQIRLEGGVTLFLAAYLAAEAVYGAGDAANGIGPAGRRVERQRGLAGEDIAGAIAASQSEAVQLFANGLQRAQRNRREQCRDQHGGQRSQQDELQCGAQERLVGFAQKGRPHPDVNDEERHVIAVERHGDIEYLGLPEDPAHLEEDVAVAQAVEAVAIGRALIQCIGIGRHHGEAVRVGDADVLHRRRVAQNAVHRAGKIVAVSQYVGYGGGLLNALAEKCPEEEDGQNEHDAEGESGGRKHELRSEAHWTTPP